MTTHFYLIRHGHHTNQAQAGLSIGALTAKGVLEAQKLRDRFEREKFSADVLISSTLLRAMQTAEIIAPALNLPVIHDKTVEEWSNQAQDGSTFQDFLDKISAAPQDQKAFISPGAGTETWAEFQLRAATALNRLSQEYAGKRIVLVCHGGIIEASFLYGFGLTVYQPTNTVLDAANTSITHWEKVQGSSREVWQLHIFNDTAHLNENYIFSDQIPKEREIFDESGSVKD
jgi:2,3-bisphosphoglycerate-dependent phosphoglycerate mutase